MIKTLLETLKAFYYLIFLHVEPNEQVSLDSLQVLVIIGLVIVIKSSSETN